MKAMQMAKTSKMPDPLDVQVGSRIRLQRKMKNLSQSDLGRAVGVTFQQILKYESGTNRVSASRLQLIAEALHVPVALFFEGPGVATSGETSEINDVFLFLSTNEGQALNRAFAKISDSQMRSKIINLAKAVAGQTPDEGR
jgi:transcriptional regulator with XRE-family HTH domain